jgi:hypothetical protein
MSGLCLKVKNLYLIITGAGRKSPQNISHLCRCCWSAVRSGQRGLLSPPLYGGGPPPLQPGVGDVTPPLLRSMADFYCSVAAIRDRWFIIWKGASPPPSQRRSPLRGRLSTAACAPYSAGGLDLRRGGDVVHVRLRPRYVTAQRETSATPWRSGYGDTSSPRSSKLGLVPTANSPGLGSQTSLFSFCTSTWMPLKKLEYLKPPPCWFYRPSWLQQLGTTPTSTYGSGRDRRRRGARRWTSYRLFLSRWPTFLLASVFGTLAPLGQASKFALSSPLESLMDVNFSLRRHFSQRGIPPLTTPAYCASTSTTCLYVYDLPLRLASTACLYVLPLWPASTACLYGLPSSCHRHHHHHHRPSPVQAEHLSFSFIYVYFLLHFLRLFFHFFF